MAIENKETEVPEKPSKSSLDGGSNENPTSKSKILFSRFKKHKEEDQVAIDAAELPPAKVSLLEMYKYSMWWENMINVLGLVCAAGAGVSRAII
ncbi:hypothetical protein E3P98_04134 [Wallemia ichthyophaga]|nr:hypothetical protein E3P98_04134 [Wallemia ichthyophaga]